MILRRHLALVLFALVALLWPCPARASLPHPPEAGVAELSLLAAAFGPGPTSVDRVMVRRFSLPHPRAGRRPSTDKGEAAGEAGWVGARRNALGALKVNAGAAVDDQRPKLAGGGTADAAVPNTLGGQPVALNAGGFVTSLRGTSLTWSRRGFLREAQEPIPAALEHYGYDSDLRRTSRHRGTTTEFYVHEGPHRVATLAPGGALVEGYLFDGIDHPLRVTLAATNTVAYYEVDLAGNVRALRASGGGSLGGYRYSAFGQTVEDTSLVAQPLRWKGRWFSPVAGGTYDVRARQWSPELGVFLSVDEFAFQDRRSTLWGWPGQNPTRYSDPTGRNPLLIGAGAAEGAGLVVGAGLALWGAADCAFNACQGIVKAGDFLFGSPGLHSESDEPPPPSDSGVRPIPRPKPDIQPEYPEATDDQSGVRASPQKQQRCKERSDRAVEAARKSGKCDEDFLKKLFDVLFRQCMEQGPGGPPAGPTGGR